MRRIRPQPAPLSDKQKADKWKAEMERRLEVIEARVEVIARRISTPPPGEEPETRDGTD